MVTIHHLGNGRLTVDGEPVIVQNYYDTTDRALLCCKFGRNVWILGSEYLIAVMLPPGGMLLTLAL